MPTIVIPPTYNYLLVRPISLPSIISTLKEQLKPEYMELQVRREYVLEDLISKVWF